MRRRHAAHLKINSFAVVLVCEQNSPKERSAFAERVFHKLLNLDYPIVAVLRQGEILLDVLTLSPADFPYICDVLSRIVSSQEKT